MLRKTSWTQCWRKLRLFLSGLRVNEKKEISLFEFPVVREFWAQLFHFVLFLGQIGHFETKIEPLLNKLNNFEV